MEQAIHQGQIPSPTGKKAGAACPVRLYCKEQLLSQPQPHLARVGSEPAHSWGDCSSLWVGFQTWDLFAGASKSRHLKRMVLGGYLELSVVFLRIRVGNFAFCFRC